MNPSIASMLVFGSGLCALVYQTVWLREFRMIFGGSTPASAAVLAAFMGGLGAGSFFLGRRADTAANPLRLYGMLEVGIATSAAATPFLFWMIRTAYLASGGSSILGDTAAAIVRLALSAIVLAIPTFLMGGTLPAVARAVETAADAARGRMALVYGLNTIGGVVGVLIATFIALEHLGNRGSLWSACFLNLAVAGTALALARRLGKRPDDANAHRHDRREVVEPMSAGGAATPVRVILVSAAVTGFSFLLMELVWYRMMTPLLGGTTFTFGLILAVALLGIGIGGVAYAWSAGAAQPTLSALALTCAAEAFFLIVPFALGDRLAVLALLLRPLGAMGFGGDIFAWLLLTTIIVLPSAILAGVQFPLLIALLGRGRRHVGTHTGLAYACNTLGAIAGSLAGGFGLLPALSATGAWRFSVALLCLLALFVCVVALASRTPVARLAPSLCLSCVAVALLWSTGPTAAWRQSPIGAGRVDERRITTVNSKEDWLRDVRRSVLFQEDGKESALGVTIRNGITFLINGKSDGNAVHDAGTQIMSGLLGALLHPNPRHSLVVGLGTGSTAGWLGAIPSMERVDVVELEAAVLKVAELCAPVNQDVLRNSKVAITIGDARETLLTTRQHYDLIVSEPSNPYRAGVASLYTAEYYRAAVDRLRPGGLFLQFVQAYEVDSTTIRTIYATFATAFRHVETWQTNQGDLLFIGSSSPIAKDSGRLRERMAEAPFADALASAWGVKDLEGVLAYFVADEAFAEELLRAGAPPVNTDDRNIIEFSFGRAVGKPMNSVIPELREAAHRRGHDRPTVAGTVDWRRVDEQNLSIGLLLDAPPAVYGFLDEAQRKTATALTAYVNGNIGGAVASWSPPSVDAANITELAATADMLGWAQDARASEYIDRLALTNAAEATLLRAMVLARRGFFADAAAAFEIAYQGFRKQPWAIMPVLQNSFPIAEYIAAQDPTGGFARQIYSAIEQPFSVYTFEADRRKTLLALGKLIDGAAYSEFTRRAVTLFEPNVPWDREFLQTRHDCYKMLGDARQRVAEIELKRFLRGEPQRLDPAPSAAR